MKCKGQGTAQFTTVNPACEEQYRSSDVAQSRIDFGLHVVNKAVAQERPVKRFGAVKLREKNPAGRLLLSGLVNANVKRRPIPYQPCRLTHQHQICYDLQFEARFRL
jgi:hypothetical protein